MKKLGIVLILSLFDQVGLCQGFEIPKEKSPFFDILDWRGEGAILMSKDPKGAGNQILLTFVGNEPRSKWQETILPKIERPTFIHGDGTRYVYFLDQVELNNGKFTFYQLNNAGNVKPTDCSYTVAFKKLGYDVNALKLVDVQVTDKALLHLFETYDKTTKSTVLLGGFMTHNNYLAYAAEIGRWQEDKFQVNYGGFSGDQIAFYAYSEKDKKQGMDVWYMSSKGEKKDATFIELPPLNGQINSKQLGPCGALSLKNKITPSGFVASYQGGGWSAIIVDNGLQVVSYENKQWLKKAKTSKILMNKNGYSFGLYRMKDGFLVNNEEISTFLPTNSNYAVKSYEDSGFFNSSKALDKESNKKAVFDSGSHFLYFDTQQLNKEGGLKFELKAK